MQHLLRATRSIIPYAESFLAGFGVGVLLTPAVNGLTNG